MSQKSKFRSDYICRVRYRNILPPVPYEPKMLTIPSLVERHVPYQSTSLVEQTPYSLIMDQSAAIPFEKALVEYLDKVEGDLDEVSKLTKEEKLDLEDEPLMKAPIEGQANGKGKINNVTWLRRSEYIAQETRGVSNRKEGVESKFAMSAASAKKRSYATIEEQLTGVENTFKPLDIETLVHPQTKKKAIKIMPLLPDMTCWENIYTIGQFSAEPADEARLAKRRAVERDPDVDLSKLPQFSEMDAADRGILRPMVNPHDSDDTYLVWFLPDAKSTERLREQKGDPLHTDLSGETLTYNAVRDYEYRNEAGSGSKHLLITIHNDSIGEVGNNTSEKAYYCPIRSKMVVRKKRAQSAKFKYMDDYEKPNVLNVTYTKY